MNLYVLELKFSFNGKENCIYPVILQNEKETILVDCGYPGFMPLIEKAATYNGISLQSLTGIIITHHDIDHMGGLFEMKARFPSVKVYSSSMEENFITGKEKSLRLVQAESIYDSLPQEQKQGTLSFQEMRKNVQPVPVDYTFSEDKDVSFLNGAKIIHTPGHTPGYISIYLKDSKTLIAADALVCEGGELEIANPDFTLNLPQAITSIKKIQALEMDKILCYHGDIVDNDIQHRLNKLIYKYSRNDESKK